MAMPVTIPAETALAGDGYAIIHIAEDRTFDAAETWSAQVRKRPADTTAAATFTVTSRAGTVDDEATGEDETGNTVVVAQLTGTQTRTLVGSSYHCDLQAQPAVGDPVTFLAWQLTVKQDVTR